MGAKDLTQRIFFDHNDVFADVVNVLLFHGEQRVKPSDLEGTGAVSQYKPEGGGLRSQERDVAKYWKNGEIRIALCGIENQTAVDRDMPLRVIGYDGAAYRNQLGKSDHRYPVITLVLYFGKGRWTGPRSLHESLGLSPEWKELVSDYTIHVFELDRLEQEIAAKSKSDFGAVVEFLAQSRRNPQYSPSKDMNLVHVSDALDLLASVTQDERYRETAQTYTGKENVTMCEVLDYRENRGWLKGRTEGRLEGRDEALLDVGLALYLDGKSDSDIEKYSKCPAEMIVQAALRRGYKRGQNLGAAGAGN